MLRPPLWGGMGWYMAFGTWSIDGYTSSIEEYSRSVVGSRSTSFPLHVGIDWVGLPIGIESARKDLLRISHTEDIGQEAAYTLEHAPPPARTTALALAPAPAPAPSLARSTSTSSTSLPHSPARGVVEQHHLCVLARLQLYPSGIISRGHVRVQVDDLTVALVLEQQSLCVVGDHLANKI